jgi:hypothetical protein
VVRAQAGVDPKASRVIITRGSLKTNESYDLLDADTDNILVYPGNTVEICSGKRFEYHSVEYYFIGGESTRRAKNPIDGLTLYQAVVAPAALKDTQKKRPSDGKTPEAFLMFWNITLKPSETARQPTRPYSLVMLSRYESSLTVHWFVQHFLL